MISIIMPYFERQAALDRALRVYTQLYPYDDIEISLCDDGSGVLLQRNVDVRFPFLVRRMKKKLGALNPCIPINRAVEQSTGDLILLTSPEIVHRTPILEAMRSRILDSKDYVIAACWDVEQEKWLSHSTMQGKGNGRMPFPKGTGFHFCVMFTRELWELAGGFDEGYRKGQGCDDNDWLWRVENVGARFIMLDECVVDHYKDGGARCRWPPGGLKRNKQLLTHKWGYKWNQS